MENISIAAYCRISVDEELDRDNASIENQRAIIAEYAAKKFPGSSVCFYEDRDRSGYTFEQREGYQKMRPLLMNGTHAVLIVKDFSRFSRRNSRGLVELEDLRDRGVRMISIGDSIDYPRDDDWVSIQFRFLVNEMPVTDTSKKVKRVIQHRQSEGKWICAVPYGYLLTDTRKMEVMVDAPAAEVVRKIFELYNGGWGYKKIANHLTDIGIPTPRAAEISRLESQGRETRLKSKNEWSIITVQTILANDFYIGTLRQAKYRRKKINGGDMKNEAADHIVFENHHEAIIDYRTFAVAREQMKTRAATHYRGVKKYANVYSGFLYCGDCGAPMFSMSRPDLAPAYICGAYHKRGTKGCSSHHTRVDLLDAVVKQYVARVMDNAADMMARLDAELTKAENGAAESEDAAALIERALRNAKDELKATTKQKIRELMKRPDEEDLIDETFAGLERDLERRIKGLEGQLDMTLNRRGTMIQANRTAKTAMEVFHRILEKPSLDKTDIEFIVRRITVFGDRIDIQLKSDIDAILRAGTENAPDNAEASQKTRNQREKRYAINVINEGDPLEIFTDREGEIILKKYSPIGELGAFAKEYAESLAQSAGHITCIVDKDQIIAVSGGARKELLEKHISPALEKHINTRAQLTAARADSGFVPILDDDTGGLYNHELISPIISEGDVLGAVIFLSPDQKMGDVESKLAQTAAGFLGKQMEQ